MPGTIEWCLHHLTAWRWYVLLFCVGVVLRWLFASSAPLPFGYWLRLRGRNVLMSYCFGKVTTRLEVALLALLVPLHPRLGLLHHVDLTFASQCLAGVLLLDLTFYFRHRLDHAVAPLWRIHRVHHSDPEIDVTTAAFGHPFSGVLRILWQALAVMLLGIPKPALMIYVTVEGYLAYLQHSAIRFERFDRIVRCCGLISPLNHELHHSRDLHETDSNFGTLFSFWDRLFGTYRCGERFSRVRSGLAEFDAPQSQTIEGLLLSPFRDPHLPRLTSTLGPQLFKAAAMLRELVRTRVRAGRATAADR
jgi:sterol desaturase/sphingolipid hydroxylase (fatty acid hydroxylase superfamily)